MVYDVSKIVMGQKMSQSDGKGQSGGWVAVFLTTCLMAFPPIVVAQIKEVKQVLILNQLEPAASPGVNLMNQQIIAALNKSPYQIEIHTQVTDSALFPDEASQRELRAWLLRKYRDIKPEIMFAVGITPLKWLLEWDTDFFPGVPVVFCGSTDEMLSDLKLGPRFTGVWGKVEPVDTLEAALRLLPATRRVVVVGGVGEYDKYLGKIASERLQPYESRFEFIYMSNLDMPTILERVRNLPPHTIIYHTSIMVDAAGTRFVDADQSVPLLVSAANAPIFTVDDVDIGRGTIGGNVLSFKDQGRDAGEIGVRILKGERPQDIPPVTRHSAYIFDWRALKRWGLNENSLPADSILINYEPTAWQSYKREIIVGIIFIGIEGLLILSLLLERARKKRAEKSLRESERRFRLMADTAPVLIWLSGTDKLCNYFNPAWLSFTGRTFEAELGTGWLEGVHPDDVRECIENYDQAFDRRAAFKIEFRLRRHDAEYRWVLDSGVPRFNPDGSFAGYIGSAFDVTDHKKAMESLAGVSRRLIEAQEKERHHIARELHDDFNQRIALLAGRLQHHQDALPESSIRLREEVAQLSEFTIELSRDVQSLSHRLHSSKLDLLGLVAAIKGFCKELATQQKLEIDFEHGDVPRSLPQDISLCIFRIVQEALHNAVKHSGVKHFEVNLHGAPDLIVLVVRDFGVGFNVDEAIRNHGIGLVSMRERVNSFQGSISFASKPMEGTEIRVQIPYTTQVSPNPTGGLR